MKKILKMGIILIFIFMLSGCEKKYLTEISYQEYENLLKNKESFILEIMRTDCSACISFKPKITAVTKKYKIEVKYINTDHLTEEENNELATKTGISGTPTVIFYNKGEELTISSRINGAVSEEKIISKLKANGIITK